MISLALSRGASGATFLTRYSTWRPPAIPSVNKRKNPATTSREAIAGSRRRGAELAAHWIVIVSMQLVPMPLMAMPAGMNVGIVVLTVASSVVPFAE